MFICFVFFKFLGIVLGKDIDMFFIDDLLVLVVRCFEVVKCNMCIVIILLDFSLFGRDFFLFCLFVVWMLICV